MLYKCTYVGMCIRIEYNFRSSHLEVLKGVIKKCYKKAVLKYFAKIAWGLQAFEKDTPTQVLSYD